MRKILDTIKAKELLLYLLASKVTKKYSLNVVNNISIDLKYHENYKISSREKKNLKSYNLNN